MSLSHLDLNLLLTLDAVLSEGSVARAAERLHVTPPAVSNALARLRAVLGDPLVVRSGRGIVPTPRGLELAPVLKSTLGALEQAIRRETFEPATTTRQFTVAVSDAGQISWLPAFGRQFSSHMPNAGLRIVGIDTYLSWGGPPSPEVDVAVAAIAEPAPGVHISPLYEEQSVLVARRGRALPASRPTRTELSDLRHVEVQVAPGRGYRGLDQLYARLGIERRVVMIVPSFAAAAAVVAETDLVAMLPAGLVAVFSRQFDLDVVQEPALTVKTAVNLIWHARTDSDPASRAFRALLAGSFGHAAPA